MNTNDSPEPSYPDPQQPPPGSRPAWVQPAGPYWQWGAEPPRPSPSGRWIPLLLSGIVLALAVGLVAGVGLFGRRAGSESNMTYALQQRIDQLQARLDQAGRAAAGQTEDLAGLQERLAAAKKLAEQRLDRLETLQAEFDSLARRNEEVETELAAQQEQARQRLEAAREKIELLGASGSELQVKIQELQVELETARKQAEGAGQLATRIEQLQSNQRRLEQAVRESAAEAQRLRTRGEKLLQENQDLQSRLQQEQARPALDAEALRRAYLAAAAPGASGLEAIQRAVERTNLLQRLGEIRSSPDGRELRDLLEQIEAVLVRAELLDVSSGSRQSLGQVIREGRLIERIDGALADLSAPPGLRGWLTEAKILLGALANVP